MSQAASSHVASQILSLHGERVILPNTAVAEIIPYVSPDALSDAMGEKAPDWLLGMIAWRGISVPLISMEIIFGSSYEKPGKRSSIAIINATGSAIAVPYFAVVTQGIPRLLQVSAETLGLIEETGDTNKAAACHVVFDGDVAVIPDMDEVESMLRNVFESSAKSDKKKSTAKKKKNTSSKKKK